MGNDSEMYEIYIKRNFSAAHKLRGYVGDCSKLHGHNWKVTVLVQSRKVDNIGISIDFRKLRAQLGCILKELDHSDLNTIEGFKKRNPTSENIAEYIYKKLAKKIKTKDVKLAKVIISESDNSGAAYFE